MFEYVNPKFLENAKQVETSLISRIAEITHFTPEAVKKQLEAHAFEITHAMVNDLCYLAKGGGLQFITLLAVTLNKILNPQYENDDNDAASINWILNGISDLKYNEVEEIVETAQSLLEEANEPNKES